MGVHISQLGFGLVLLLMAQHTPAAADPSPQCQKKCGNVEIHYPFGIGVNCSLSRDFAVNCNVQDAYGNSKPFIGDFELTNISLVDSTIRVLSYVSTYCYNPSTGSMDFGKFSEFNASGTPYRFSYVHNKFTVMGCNTIGYISDSNRTCYQSGCVSTCIDRPLSESDIGDGSCTGLGCCQTAIPKDMDYYEVGFDKNLNTSRIWRNGRCSYAALMEAAKFNFSAAYMITTSKLNDTNTGRVPMVVDWAVRNGNMSCAVAKQNKTGTYACVSSNSECLGSPNGPGYVCNCSQGYEGNPYLTNGGCHDIDECKYNPCPFDGICHNMLGTHRCSCQVGRKFNKGKNACDPDAGLIARVTLGFFGLMIFSFVGYMILQKRKLTKVKQEHFRQHGGMILFERMKSERGLAFKVFTEAEITHATNNYDSSRVIGKGGHGMVYKGIIKDNMPVAIKRCMLIDERHKKEFGQEMLILSHINHKNIVKLVGCCLEVEVPMLVYEFIPNGTLFELIHGKSKALQISFGTLLRIVHEAAEGLSFLHSYASPPIIHGDVKTANILLDNNYTAKVSDFGASVLGPSEEDQYVTMVQGTCGYLDPEYMQTCQLTDKSDVYSFGVVILEVLTGQVPLKLDGSGTQRSLSSNFLLATKENDLDAVLPSHLRGQESAELVRGLSELAKQSLDMCGTNRPSMKEVANELGRLRKLSLHPWAQLEAKRESQSLLGGTSSPSFETLEDNSSGYPTQEGEILQMSPGSLYHAR